MKIIENRFLPFKGFMAITILNMIFIKKGTILHDVDIQHEEIHWKQEKELLIVGFYLWYVVEFLIRLIIEWNFFRAYKKISFEQEAYMYQRSIGYFGVRHHYEWVRFLCR